MLGPLLFLCYINDLPNNLQSSVRLFADDCVIYREIQNEFDSNVLQEDLDTLRTCKWETNWQLCFNPSKCFVMRLTHSRDRTTLNPSTIDVMVDSPSKKQKPARYKLPFSGNLFLVRVVIYDKN